ncbi:ParB/RepB/Spo0J family partition protein [Tersicoccus sp. Bi-70]|uniref:ParB/RepB/Spo0J family partition protein n=1 Tax=Tersicoccus sp. Bi-70 TaxID=1897634 RepID=UPI000976BBF8|nr:ParB/RepB/Spo0J family partition protein [Tersicoccus sp. Bi-70]OMH32566.1 hypothetical protein BGP79_07110 [Tersicoccus sp. Bi-70]
MSENPTQSTTTPALVELDPSTLTVDTNVRADAGLTPAFVASVREHGVLVPVVAHRGEDGTVKVLMGQRRTLAAVEAGQATIPVHLVATPEEADRLARQVVENDQRTGLTETDRAEAIHQLSLLGVSPTRIAKRVGVAKTTVETTLAVKANATATEALATGLTIDQALVLAQFDGDDEAQEQLTAVALRSPESLAHEASRLKASRERAALVATAQATATERGLTILDRNPAAWGYDGDAVAVAELAKPSPTGPVALTEEDANAVYVGTDWSGEVVHSYAVLDWKSCGYSRRRTSGDYGAAGGGMTEEQKAERRAVVENNRAMEAAQVVRREFVATLLSRKTPPKDAARFIAARITGHAYQVGHNIVESIRMAKGEDGPAWAAKRTTDPTMVALAAVIGCIEADMDRGSWRNRPSGAGEYLTALIGWGYTPADVERLMADTK